MKRGGKASRRLRGEVMRLLAVLGLVAGAAMVLVRPPPKSAAAGRGQYSHTPGAEAIREGYEVADLSAKGLGTILATLAVSAATLVGIVFGMISLFSTWDAQDVAHLTAQQKAAITPPSPHLQTDPVGDLDRERERERRELASYAWIDVAHTRAHIPIERAMTVVAGHSLDESP